MKLQPLLLVVTLLAAPALAQMKPKDTPPGGLASPATSSPATPAVAADPGDPARAAKEKAATEAAQRWLALIDAGDYGKAWDECGPLFQSRVTRKQWVEGLPKNRAPFGAMKSRNLETAQFRSSLQGAPAGEYVTVAFVTTFEKQDKVVEAVTLVLDGSTWRPIGYLIQ